MEPTDPWSARMRAALDELKARLQASDLPRLERAIGAYKSNYDHLYQLLVRKSLIKEDRYGYDAGPTRLAVPSDEDLPESQAREGIGVRMADYRAQLEFLATKVPLALGRLTLGTVRRTGELMQYIRWSGLSTTSDSPVTRAVADYVKRIKAADDAMAAQLASTTVSQLERCAREALAILKRTEVFLRESYKAMLRDEVLAAVGSSATAEETAERVKRHFATALKGKPFYPELLHEVLAEDSPSGEEARARALARIADGGRQQPARPAAAVDRDALLQAVRALASAAAPLADSAAKIAANDQATRGGPAPRGLRALLRRIAGHHPEKAVRTIEYLDGAVIRSETIDLVSFVEEVGRLARLLAALVRPDGAAAARVLRASDQSLADFLDRQTAALQAAYRRLAGLSDMFRKQAPAESAVKGIKIELTLLKNCLARCSQIRRSAAAARPAEDQSGPPGPAA